MRRYEMRQENKRAYFPANTEVTMPGLDQQTDQGIGAEPLRYLRDVRFPGKPRTHGKSHHQNEELTYQRRFTGCLWSQTIPPRCAPAGLPAGSVPKLRLRPGTPGGGWPREGCFPEGCQLTFLPWPYSALYGYEVSSCRPFEVCR
jgi:hypothetical protein